MKTLFALLLCFVLPITVLAADSTYKVVYDGGSLPDMKSGTGLKMSIGATDVHFLRDNKEIVVVPASAITEISYGQDVHRRVGSAIALGAVTLGIGALMALTKSKKHFVGLTWANGDKKGGSRYAVRQE
jgi:hypothetical protein